MNSTLLEIGGWYYNTSICNDLVQQIDCLFFSTYIALFVYKLRNCRKAKGVYGGVRNSERINRSLPTDL